ncbi:type II toxin-antitoxin system HicA family toxin [Siccirubricoccus phaeus]|uniref:type II toxin-antitoxin system HicA family toxin n=1 Tax=Siccirubricoccus phaeus TaxID=2595053 RepID=UPI00165BE656|nr:type II toxin-antitoxin system HicA family toxin [Siccirubricoccus phaeus]
MGGTFDRDLKGILHDAGWRFERFAKGNHEIWQHPDKSFKLTVPQGIVSKHTANGVLKQAGLRKHF